MRIRAEQPADIPAVRAVVAAAFATSDGRPPVEVALLDALRDDVGWLPDLSLVADDGQPIGYVVCTRGHVADTPALGLGPIAVSPDRQRTGVGTALMQAVIAAADRRGEPLIALLGSPDYYRRFGFRPATAHGIAAPDPSWGDHFQVRPLARWRPVAGTFGYSAPFADL